MNKFFEKRIKMRGIKRNNFFISVLYNDQGYKEPIVIRQTFIRIYAFSSVLILPCFASLIIV